MQSTGCNVARSQLLQAARRIARYIMVAPCNGSRPGKKADGNDGEKAKLDVAREVQREMKGK